MNQGPGDGGTLFLSAGECHTSLADESVKSPGKSVYRFFQGGNLRCCPDLFLVRIVRCDGDVVPDTTGKQKRFLENNGHVFSEPGRIDVPKFRPANCDASAVFGEWIEL